jgi:hypothetical protein
MRGIYFFWVFIVCALLTSSIEALRQYRESQYVNAIAAEVVRKAGAEDNRSRVIALRDYLRERVTYRGAAYDDRPFLRATTAETLRAGRGYCGEVTRAFINMAGAVGVRAQRINLYGGDNHVVAEAELQPGERALVDSQNPPHVRDLESLDQALLRPEYDDYSTLHLRRLHVNWLVSRVKLELGTLTYLIENPHALKSVLWLALAMTSLAGKFLSSLVLRPSSLVLRPSYATAPSDQ